MTATALSHSVTLNEDLCEVRFAISGFWTLDGMQEFLRKLDLAALPLVKARKPIFVFGDFTDFAPQDRETSEAIRDQLMNAKKFGLRHVAIIGASALVKMQYKRISAGVDVQFFEEKFEALDWLREQRG